MLTQKYHQSLANKFLFWIGIMNSANGIHPKNLISVSDMTDELSQPNQRILIYINKPTLSGVTIFIWHLRTYKDQAQSNPLEKGTKVYNKVWFSQWILFFLIIFCNTTFRLLENQEVLVANHRSYVYHSKSVVQQWWWIKCQNMS